MRQIVPGSGRWRLAQLALRLLYGRGRYYVSPWQHAAVAAAAYMVHDGRLLMARRGEGVEHAGKLDVPGGHVDLERREGILEALCREVREEVGLLVRPEDFPPERLLFVGLVHDQDYIQLKGAARVGLRYWLPLDAARAAALRGSEEAQAPRFYSFAEIAAARDEGRLVPGSLFERALQLKAMGVLTAV